MWKTVKLDDIADVKAGNPAPQDKIFFENGVYPFVRTSDVGKVKVGSLSDANDKLNQQGIAKLKLFPKGTILFPKSGASTFLNHRVILEMDAYVASHLATIKSKQDDISDKYLWYFLQTIDAADLVADSSYPSLNTKTIQSISVPLPPLVEQQRIVSKLDTAFAEIDEAKESHMRKTQECGSLVNVAISKILKKFTEQNPTSSSLGEVTYTAGRIGWKGLTKKEYVEQGYLFLSVHGLNYGKFVDFGDAFRITKERFEESPEIMLEQGDVLLCKDGAGIGKLGIVNELNEPATINSSLLLIRPNESLSSEYVYYYLLASEFQSIIQSKIDGATTPHLYQRDIRNLPIIFPEKRFQKQAVAEIEAAIAKIEEIRLSSLRNSINYAALKTAILAQELQSSEAA